MGGWGSSFRLIERPDSDAQFTIIVFPRELGALALTHPPLPSTLLSANLPVLNCTAVRGQQLPHPLSLFIARFPRCAHRRGLWRIHTCRPVRKPPVPPCCILVSPHAGLMGVLHRYRVRVVCTSPPHPSCALKCGQVDEWCRNVYHTGLHPLVGGGLPFSVTFPCVLFLLSSLC